MAKRKKLRAAQASQADDHTTNPHQPKGPGPANRQKRQHRYHQKQQAASVPFSTPSASPTSTSTNKLSTHFHALPPELRAEIFAWLLVRPAKWSVTHAAACELRTVANPHYSIRPRLEASRSACAAAHWGPDAAGWRHGRRPVWVDPWRSAWAPAQRNPYLCTGCYDSQYRASPHPGTARGSLPCLCARRADLQVLLVCRRWYEEGGRVFYSRNVFAFGGAGECVGFLGSLPGRWRGLVSKVSLLALAPAGVYPEDGADEMACLEVLRGVFREAWALLAQLPALSELELDAIMLTRLECVGAFRGVPLRNLRSIRFTQSVPMKSSMANREYIWPRRGVREIVDDSNFAQDVARGIKGQRFGWVRGKKREDRRAIIEEKARYRTRFAYVKHEEQSEDESKDDEYMSSGSMLFD